MFFEVNIDGDGNINVEEFVRKMMAQLLIVLCKDQNAISFCHFYFKL